MKALLLFTAILMIALGLTGVFWPEGLMDLAKYSFTRSGSYIVAAIRILLGTFLFTGAGATRTPKTVRVIGGEIFSLRFVGGLISHQPAQRLIGWGVAQRTERFFVSPPPTLRVGAFSPCTTSYTRRSTT